MKLAPRLGASLAIMVLGTLATAQSGGPAPSDHAHIRAAVAELREAARELRSAKHDFCGHQVEASEKTGEALAALEAALACVRH